MADSPFHVLFRKVNYIRLGLPNLREEQDENLD